MTRNFSWLSASPLQQRPDGSIRPHLSYACPVIGNGNPARLAEKAIVAAVGWGMVGMGTYSAGTCCVESMVLQRYVLAVEEVREDNLCRTGSLISVKAPFSRGQWEGKLDFQKFIFEFFGGSSNSRAGRP